VPAALDAVDQSTRRWSASQFTMQHCYALVSRVDCDLYAGDAEVGLARVDAAWPALERSLSLRNVGMLILSVDARARLLLAAGHRDPLARERLQRDVAKLRANPSPLAASLVALLEAGAAASRGDAETARRLFLDAETACDGMDLALHAACARRRRGQLEGGDVGARLVAEADERLHAQGIARPDRWARTIVPV
jgi:hypothetical protein